MPLRNDAPLKPIHALLLQRRSCQGDSNSILDTIELVLERAKREFVLDALGARPKRPHLRVVGKVDSTPGGATLDDPRESA